jgi:inorganic pyrophosphatase/exopolyphosphatase
MTKAEKLKIDSELQKEFEKKFITQDKFTEEIEKYFKRNGYDNYIFAISDYCEEKSIDIESVPKLLSKQFKRKIEHQVSKLNFLKSKPLPELPF